MAQSFGELDQNGMAKASQGASFSGSNGGYAIQKTGNAGLGYDQVKQAFVASEKAKNPNFYTPPYMDPNGLAVWAARMGIQTNFGDTQYLQDVFSGGNDRSLAFVTSDQFAGQYGHMGLTADQVKKNQDAYLAGTQDQFYTPDKLKGMLPGLPKTTYAPAPAPGLTAGASTPPSGVEAAGKLPTPSASSLFTNLPQRGNYKIGVAGDKSYQLALDRYNAANQPMPSSLSEATSPVQFDQLLNKIGADQLSQASSASDVSVRSNSSDAFSGNADFFQKFISGESVAPAQGGNQAAPQFSATDKLSQLRQQYGVDPLEAQVSDIDKQITDIQALQRKNASTEQGKAVTLGVMGGRISEEARQANEKIDELNRQKGYAVDQLQNKYSVVNSMMSAAQTDYKNAVDAYNTKFTQTVQATNLMMDIDQSQKTATEKARDDARANVTIITNSLSNGSLQWDNLDPATKTQFAKLELQAGLPTGTISAFSQKAGSAWEMSTVLPGVDENGNQIATVLQKNKQTGEFKTTKLITDYAPKATGGAKADVLQQGTFVNDQGNEVAWTRYKDGTVDQVAIGKAKQTADQMNPDQKAQNDFNKFFADIVTKMQAQDSFGEPKLSKDGAMKIIKAQYPNITTESLNSLLAGF